MTIYLTIITTVLVITQIIRLIQNAVQLKSMKEELSRRKEIDMYMNIMEKQLEEIIKDENLD